MFLWLRQFIGTRQFYRELFLIATPIALQQFITSMVNLLDTIMIANYDGSTATAAVAVANRYFNSVQMILISFAIGSSVYIAQFFGAQRNDRVRQVFGMSLGLMSVLGVVFGLFGWFFKVEIIRFFLGFDSDSGTTTFTYAVEYLGMISLTLIPVSITHALSFTFRPLRQTVAPLIAAGLAMGTNAILNFIFIFGFGPIPSLGVYGASLATIISRLVELTFLLGYFYISKPVFYGTFRQVFSFSKELFILVMKRSQPLFLSQILTESIVIYMLFLFARIEVGNATNLAAITVATQVTDIMLIFFGGMGTAASVLIGSRLGANRLKEAEDHGRYQLSYVILMSLLALFLTLLIIPFAQPLFGFEAEELPLMGIILMFQAMSLPFSVIAMNSIFIVRAGGVTSAPIYINNIVYLFIKVPLLTFLVFVDPEIQTKWAFIQWVENSVGMSSFIVFIFLIDRLIEIIRAIIGLIIYKQKRWIRNIVNHVA